jgi:hypothetical protein
VLVKKKQPVLFAGENHLITLYQPGSNKHLIRASCWRCTYSEEGIGTVLCLALDHDYATKLGVAAQLVLSDNSALAEMIVRRFNQYFDGFRDLGFATLHPRAASFQQSASDGQYRVSCDGATIRLELLWLDPREAALEIFYNTSGPVPYDVSAVIASCQGAQIILNDEFVEGEIHVPDGASASSAFLAFSETWAAA